MSRAPESGSIIHTMFAEIAAHPDVYAAGALTGIAPSVAVNYITRFIDYVVKQAAGLLSDSEYDEAIRVFNRQEPYFDELVDKVEPHIAAAHAPIERGERIFLQIGNASPIQFDLETKEYTSASNWAEKPIPFVGFVSRLNLLTGNGRMYSKTQRKVLSFSQADAFRHTKQAELLSWSLRQKDTNLPSDIEVMATTVTSNSGRIKRLWVEGAQAVAHRTHQPA